MAKESKPKALKAPKTPKAPKAKSKKKVSSSGGDNFLLLHGEKLVFAVLGVLALYLMTRGSGMTPFTLTSDALKSAASNAESHIKASKVEIKDIDAELDSKTDYFDYASLIKSSLKADAYETDNRWEQSLFPEKILRPDIHPLTVENLRAVACVGAIRYAKANAAGGVNQQNFDDKGEHWITVTGLVPVTSQMKAYNDALGRSEFTDPNRDVPKYLFYDIYRGKVDEKTGETEWEEKPIDLAKVYADEVDKWAMYGVDPVSADYSVPLYSMDSPSLTMECPPLVNKNFGAEVTNLPNIPLMSETQKEDLASMMEDAQKQEDAVKKGQTRNFNSVLNTSIFTDTQNTGKGGRASGAHGAMPMMPGPMGMGPGMGMPMANRSSGNIMKETRVDYYLFRFFDFSVKEGETYQYKVKLYLANPNYGLDVNLVEDGNSVLNPTVVSDESKPSNPVTLGSGSRILAESIEGARPGQEPKITIYSVYFNVDDAKESLSKERRVERGQVANFLGEQYTPINLAGVYTTSADTGKSQRSAKVDHKSDVCIVDAEGGEKIADSELTSQSKLLVMEPSGLLTIHSGSEDAEELLPYLNASGIRR